VRDHLGTDVLRVMLKDVQVRVFMVNDDDDEEEGKDNRNKR
jgi:hypothetical protein